MNGQTNVYHTKIKFSSCLLCSSLPSDSVKSSWNQNPKRSALNLNLYHWNNWNCSSVHQSIHLFIHPSSTALSLKTWSRGCWACPSSLWAKGRKTRQLVSGQSHLTSTLSLQFICPLNACPWTVAGSHGIQITDANSRLNTKKNLWSESFWLWGDSAKHSPNLKKIYGIKSPKHMNCGYTSCLCRIVCFMKKIGFNQTKSHGSFQKHKIHCDISQKSLTYLGTFRYWWVNKHIREGLKAPWSPWQINNWKRCKSLV